MAELSADIEIRAIVTNRRSIKAFWRACELVGNVAEDYP